MFVMPSPEEIASWPPPNYVDPVTRRPLVLGIEIPLLLLVVLFVSMRFYSRTVIVKALGGDDWFMLAAAVTTVATTTMTMVSTERTYQTGYHVWDLTPELFSNPVRTGQMALATQLLFVPITAFTKISVLLTYLRIFPSSTNHWFCYVMLVFTSAWAIAAFCAALFQCRPIQAYWMPAQYPGARCLSIPKLHYSTGCLNIFSDFLIFLWPAKDLSRVQISVRQRITLIIMFSLGIIICIAGICRIWYTSIFVTSYDILWHGATLYAIVCIETSLGIICGCLPACKPLMSRLWPRIFASTQHSAYPSRLKKVSKAGSASFRLQSLNGGNAKSDGYSVEYNNAPSRAHSQARKCPDGDDMSAGSEDWIITRDNPNDMGGQRVESQS